MVSLNNNRSSSLLILRVPASFCGVLGIRPSQGIISMAGVTSLTPSFDTVGVFSNSIEVLSRVTSALLDNESQDDGEVGNIYIINDLIELCSDVVKSSLKKISNDCFNLFKKHPVTIRLNDIDKNANHPISGIANTFLNVFCSETWTSISSWANEVELEFGKNTYVDFSFMKKIDKKNISKAFLKKEIFFKKLNNFLSHNNIFLIPTTPFLPVPRPASNTKINVFDYEKLRPLISIASVGKLPQLNIPLLNQDKTPIGVSLVAGYRRDVYLIQLAKKILNYIQSLEAKQKR